MYDQITPKIPPPLNIPSSSSIVKVEAVDTTLRLCVNSANFFDPVIPGHDKFNCIALAFLVTNERTGKKVLFDAGGRKDYWNYAPSITTTFKKGVNIKGMQCEKSVDEVLTDVGEKLEDLEAVIWSHYHFDHTGDVSKFPKTVSLVVGEGFKENQLPGYPTNPDSAVLESDFEGRELKEIKFEEKFKIGNFRAHDYFGDGSFYLLDVPGHAIGHMCGLARTTPSTFVLMGGDTCHFPGAIRPTPYNPLPASIDIAKYGMDTVYPTPCPCSLFLDFHSSSTPHEKRTTPYYRASKTPASVYSFPEIANESIDGLKEFDASDDVLVCLAHDPTLLEVLPLLNSGKGETLNDWKRLEWKEKVKWQFLNELPRKGKPGREPLVVGFWRDGKVMEPKDALEKQ